MKPEPVKNKPRSILVVPGLILGGVCTVILYLLAEPSSFIWVMDRGALLNESRLVKLCPNGAQLLEIPFGQGEVVGADPRDGTVWTTELNDLGHIHFDEVVRIDRDGYIVDRYPGYRSMTLAVDPRDGSLWLGAFINESDQLVKFNPDLQLIRRFGEFSGVESIAVDPRDGSLWVADGMFHRRLVHLTGIGMPLFEIPTPGFFSNAPHQVAVDPRDGSAWYTGFHSGNVYKIAADGTLLAAIPGFDRPVSVSVEARDGSVWVAAFSVETPGAVVKLSSQGEVIQRVVLDAPPHIAAVDPYDGSIWVGIAGALIKLDGNGGILQTSAGFTEPKSIAFTDSRGEFAAKLKCIFYSLAK